MTYSDASILDSIKKKLGLDAGYTEFDVDIITHINSVFATLQQLAVGPTNGFSIEDKEAKWSDYLPVANPQLNMVRSYMYLKVRLLFDPPTTSFAIESFQNQVKEYEWRLNVTADTLLYPEPTEDEEEGE
ncbi:MAG: hypothetical protein BWY50_01997 [Spirochaetes bacterium ADurb.Bin315]|nr:MAG: hypothetical protein BWY50_01997 [Spirochaetes bacterium ADurb.Bin315]